MLNNTRILTTDDIELIRLFLTVRKKIISRTQTKLTVRQQKQIGKVIKRARLLKF